MTNDRIAVYAQLAKLIGNTPLVRFDNLLPNGNTLYVKEECRNPWAFNHYVRVYFALYRHFEEAGVIKPGQRVYDFSSGSAGIAMAAIGSQLGYRCEVALPAGGEKAREDAILQWIPKESLHLTDAKTYVDGASQFSLRFRAKNRDAFFFNHSMFLDNGVAKINETVMSACAVVTNEVVAELGGVGPDTFVTISGNGTTQLGYGRRLKELSPETQIIGVESFESAFAFEKLYPGRAEAMYGVKPEMRKAFPRHGLPGTSFPVHFPLPALEASVPFLSDEKLVWWWKTVGAYKEMTGRSVPEDAIFWDQDIPEKLCGYGRTTWAGYAVVKSLAEKTQGKSYLITAYDLADRYDTPTGR
ncbi:MAG: pyridoxal-phosphate dependent enzyme [Candidatus Moraniibacteriota bacterium]